MSVETVDLTIATTELSSGESEYGEWKLIGVLDGEGDAVATTLKKSIQKKLATLEGKPATVVYKTDEEGRNTIISVEPTDSAPPAPPAANEETSGNGAPPTGTAVSTSAAPNSHVDARPASAKDAEQIARSVAWKAVSNDAFLKALLSTYSLSNPGEQLDQAKLHMLLAREVVYITNDILGTGDVPF